MRSLRIVNDRWVDEKERFERLVEFNAATQRFRKVRGDAVLYVPCDFSVSQRLVRPLLSFFKLKKKPRR